MLTVYGFPGAFGQPSLSPFCTKLMVHLTLAEVPYEVKRGDPRRAPTGKLPYARDGEEKVADSGAILRWVLGRGGPDLDAGLGPKDRAEAQLVARTVEEHFYWAQLYSRWVDDAGWAVMRPAIAGFLPAPLRPFVPAILRRGVVRALAAHGLGRHPPADIYAAGFRDLEALEARIQGPFFFGEDPTGTDAILAAFIGGLLGGHFDNPLTQAMKEFPRLRGLVEATSARYVESGGKAVE